MSKAKKIPLARLSDLQPGQFADFFALLAEKARGSTRDGKPFYTCRFRDARRAVSAVPIWADSPHFEECQTNWHPGQFFKVRGTFTEHEKYGPQVDIDQIRPVEDRDRKDDGFTELDFDDRTRFDPEVMFAELDALVVGEVRDPPLRHLVQGILHAHAAAAKRFPATVRTYYPFAGGWLEHTLSVTRNCVLLADRYKAHYPDLKPPLNRDLVVAGAVLHDIGRLKEMDVDLGHPARAGVDGELFGHLLLGRDVVREAARGVPDLNPELLRLLEHIVYTHLRLPEWGSPRLPLIPEVLIVHHADDLDAKLEMYARCLTRDAAEGPFTDRDPVLGRPLLKGRTV